VRRYKNSVREHYTCSLGTFRDLARVQEAIESSGRGFDQVGPVYRVLEIVFEVPAEEVRLVTFKPGGGVADADS
jgi:hypothetical protein